MEIKRQKHKQQLKLRNTVSKKNQTVIILANYMEKFEVGKK